jgi:hypothetical protein
MEFGDLIDNHNYNIHIVGSLIIPRSHVLFGYIKDILNFNLPTFGRVALLLDRKLLH